MSCWSGLKRVLAAAEFNFSNVLKLWQCIFVFRNFGLGLFWVTISATTENVFRTVCFPHTCGWVLHCCSWMLQQDFSWMSHFFWSNLVREWPSLPGRFCGFPKTVHSQTQWLIIEVVPFWCIWRSQRDLNLKIAHIHFQIHLFCHSLSWTLFTPKLILTLIQNWIHKPDLKTQSKWIIEWQNMWLHLFKGHSTWCTAKFQNKNCSQANSESPFKVLAQKQTVWPMWSDHFSALCAKLRPPLHSSHFQRWIYIRPGPIFAKIVVVTSEIPIQQVHIEQGCKRTSSSWSWIIMATVKNKEK